MRELHAERKRLQERLQELEAAYERVQNERKAEGREQYPVIVGLLFTLCSGVR